MPEWKKEDKVALTQWLATGGHSGDVPPAAALVLVAAQLGIPLELARQWQEGDQELWEDAQQLAACVSRAKDMVMRQRKGVDERSRGGR
jgi:hypothetical protein